MPKESIVSFRDGLYKTKCPTCGEPVDWEANFDADGTNYYSTCCGHSFAMYPNTVVVETTWKVVTHDN